MVVGKILTALIAANQRLITENPTTISIQRTEVRPMPDGGMQKVTSQLPPFRGRLVPRKRVPTSRQDEAGILVSSSWILVAPNTPTLFAGDTAVIDGKTYELTRVAPRSHGGMFYAQHADVEEVKL
ncbi:MAG: hypothetical protein DDT37_02012 [Firmicutes bacterium]|nr:hypothetical protein [candidate division NPL-UPA2 bacterium]